MLQAEKDKIFQRFAPVKGDVKATALRIAEFSVYFFGDPSNEGHYHIRGDVPLFHKEIYKDLADDYPLYYISAPSEFAKTTIASMVYPIYRICYFREPYTVISSRVDDTAVELLDEIKNELSDNDKLVEIFGEFKGDSRSFAWSDHFIELTNGSKVRAIGWGGNVRARKRGGYRITLFIGDDPEEVADLSSPAILKTHIKWLKRTVVPRTDKEFGKVRIVGTLIGLGGTMDNLQHDMRWKGRVYQALVDDPNSPGVDSTLPIEKRKSIWESRWPTEFLLKERRQAMRAGELDDWMFERMNEPVSSLTKNLKGYQFHNAVFYREHDQNYLRLEGYPDPVAVYTYHAIDPAFSKAESADERAQVTFAMGKLQERDFEKTCIWVLEYDFDHKDPDTIIERAIDLHKKYFYRQCVVETVGGQKLYEFTAVKSAMKDPFLINYPLAFEFINYQPRSKEDRIYAYFKTIVKLGQLYIRPGMEAIKDELDFFLQCPHLHLLDALEMGCRYAVPCMENKPKLKLPSRLNRDDLETRLDKQHKAWLLW